LFQPINNSDIIQESSWWLHGFCCGVAQRLFAKVVSHTLETNPLVMQCDDAFTKNGPEVLDMYALANFLHLAFEILCFEN
jgi:hypothetical protein